MDRSTRSSRNDDSPGACCHECGKSDAETQLRKCPICFKFFCDEHTYLWSGRPFCSVGCAEYFYFGDGEDGG